MDRAIRSGYLSRAENLVASGLNDRLFSDQAIVLRDGTKRSLLLEDFGAMLRKTLILGH